MTVLAHPRIERVRRDTLGRRIGRNWWREYIMETLLHARLAWEKRCEEAAIGYATEEHEFRREFPPPNLKDLLVSNAGMADRNRQEAC